MSQDFSQKEILTKLWDEQQKQSQLLSRLPSIEEEVKKTNGRVTAHDTRLNDLERKQENLGVKVAAGVFVATIIVSAFINRIL